MKILLLSDEPEPLFWDYYRPGRLDGFDLILSAGDLDAEYLSFLVTMAHAPLLYVHGNHDGGYEVHPPEGCDCIEDKLVTVNGLRILGLGGSAVYSRGPHQYTERQMRRRIRKLNLRVWLHKGVDIVLTHAAPHDHGDDTDYAHRGFKAFVPMLDRWKPRILAHGHVHLRYGIPRERTYGSTRIINACGYTVIEIDPDPSQAAKTHIY